MTSREFQERLARRARKAGVSLPPTLCPRLEAYFRLLATWNQKINLSGMDLTEPTPEVLDRILVEPLVAARHATAGPKVIDIGSGGGSPAIPFGLACGATRLLMVESKTRKSVFLREALRAVEFVDGEVATARYEELLSRPDLHDAHEILTVRAVRVEHRALTALQEFVRHEGHLFLFRSAAGSDAPSGVPPSLRVKGSHPLIESHSRVLVLQKVSRQ